MSVLYLDANAIAKIYLSDEEGQATVFNALERHKVIASCAISYAEVTGLMARAFHAGRLTEEQYAEVSASFAEEWNTVKVCDVSTPVSQVAAMLMKAQSGLRAMDALHLASALALRQSTPIKFLSFDKRLGEAAGKLMPEAILKGNQIVFKLTLQKAYHEGGFFNITREYDHLIRRDEGEITLGVDTEDTTFVGRVDRQANGNGTARIRARGLKDWFQRHYKMMDVVEVEIVSPQLLKLKYPSK